MSAPRVPDALLREAVAALQAAHGNQVRAARALGIPRPTLQNRLDAARLAGVSFDTPLKGQSTTLDSRAQDDEVKMLRSAVMSLERQIIEERKWRKRFDSLGSASKSPVPWLAMPAIAKRSNPHVMQLFTSDFQVGEVISKEQLDGINFYNQDVFAERYQLLIEKSINLSTKHSGVTDFSGCVYLAGGDAISNSIHEELAETNDLSAIPAIRLLRTQEREGIRRLREKFGRVKVYRIAGNHGRLHKKPRSKGYTEHNLETLLSWWLASSFDDDPKVEFFVPASGDAYYDVLGSKFLLSHGDRMGSRGGQGFIGPAATIARGHAKLHANYASTRKPLDWVLTGHLHCEIKLERGMASGALCGYSEYARDLRATPDAARQWMFLTDATRPVAQMFSIQLSPMPHRMDIPE